MLYSSITDEPNDESLNESLNKNDNNEHNNNNNKYTIQSTGKPRLKKILLPWWARIVAHIACNLLIIIAGVVILIEGISFGEAKCEKWFASVFVSVLTSIVLWQPLQVLLKYI